jgi:DNA-binding response OmpR family regulator
MILVVDDDLDLVDVVRSALEREGFAVDDAGDGATALDKIADDEPELVVLDLGLPKVRGLDVLRQVRADNAVPVIVLSGRSEEADRIIGLELGADDYVVKPFSPKELVARVRAVLRRSESAASDPEVLSVLDVVLDVRRRRVSVAGRQVELTATEFALLETLMREPGRVYTRGQLLDAVHGVSFESYERAIDAHVKNLRRKLEPEPGSRRYLQTVHGVGYRFAED